MKAAPCSSKGNLGHPYQDGTIKAECIKYYTHFFPLKLQQELYLILQEVFLLS